MYAFGDTILFIVVFGVAALLPTGLALHFLRSFEAFWTPFSIASLALAVTAPAAVFVNWLASNQSFHTAFWAILVGLGILRLFGAPLLSIAFLISAFFAPTQRSRRILIGATAIEGAVGVYALVRFFIMPFLFNLHGHVGNLN
jgi:hypothetical protein